jgi:hypothetical protein
VLSGGRGVVHNPDTVRHAGVDGPGDLKKLRPQRTAVASVAA